MSDVNHQIKIIVLINENKLLHDFNDFVRCMVREIKAKQKCFGEMTHSVLHLNVSLMVKFISFYLGHYDKCLDKWFQAKDSVICKRLAWQVKQLNDFENEILLSS